MLTKLEVDKTNVPSPHCEQMIEMLLAAWQKTDADFTAVFKKLFVTNASDGSEDFLVSDKLLSAVGDGIPEVSANLQAFVKKLIPPKDNQRKNTKGSVLSDNMKGEATIDDLEVAENSDNNNQFSSNEENNQENIAPDQNNDDVPTNTPVSAKPSVISSLQNICKDPEVNKDANFFG